MKIHGGLGNQMFQYALGRHLAWRNQVELKLDTSFYTKQHRKDTPRDFQLSIFNCYLTLCSESDIKELVLFPKLMEWNKWLNRFHVNFLPNYVYEKTFTFEPNILKLKSNIYLEGYWQTPQYFEEIETIIRQDFTFKEDISIQNKALAQKIEATESIAIHIRRGDFLTNALHNVFEMDYVLKSTQLMLEKLGEKITFFVFSDDIDWCKDNLNNVNPNIEWHYCDGGSAKEDLQLMSSCKHFIVANSSFSWWAAWLSNNINKIVVAPKKWFNDPQKDTSDLLPNTWIQI